MTLEDEPLIVAERDVRAAIEAVTVLSNLVGTTGELEAVAAARWLRAGSPQPPGTVAEIQTRLMGLRETLGHALPRGNDSFTDEK